MNKDNKISKKSNQPPDPRFTKSALVGLALELGFIIALPVLVLGLAGKWLDAEIGTEPIFSLVGMLLAIVFTTVWLYRKFSSYMKDTVKYEKTDDERRENNKQKTREDFVKDDQGKNMQD